MATLFNTKISQTYEGLLKTIDNAAISATLRELTDGSGNQSGLYLNTAGDFKVSAILEWGSLKDTGTGVTITRFVTSTDGLENFDNNTSLPTSAAVKLYVDTKFSQTDTLTEVLGFGNTTSGKDIAVSAGDDITFTDTSKILMGAGSDLQIYHDGNNSYVNDTGSGSLILKSNFLMIQSSIGENMINANENGNVNLYFDNALKFQTTLLGSTVTGDLLVTGTITGAGGSFLPLAGGTMTGNIVLNDNVKSIYGTSNDGLEIYHDGSNSYIADTGTGTLNLRGSTQVLISGANGEVGVQYVENAGVGLRHNNIQKLGTSSAGVFITGTLSTTSNVTVGANATFVDNGKAIFGAGSDLQIYHDGSHSKIEDLGTGDLKLITNGAKINLQKGSSENLASFIVDGANEFYYDAIKRLETVTDGAKVTGNLEVTGTITGSGGSFLPLAGGTMTGDIDFSDNVKAVFGAGNDLSIVHDSSNSKITNITGNLKIGVSSLLAIQNNGYDENIASFAKNGAVQLYYDNSNKFETTNTGISVTGDGVFTGDILLGDDKFVELGAGRDFIIGHNGSDALVRNYTGTLYIDQAAVTQSTVFRVSDANSLDVTALTISRNGDLTTGRDVTIAGDLTVNGTTTTVNSQTLAVVDPLIQLAKDNTANSLDIGMYGDYNDGTGRYLGLFSDASDSNKFKLFKGTTVEPTTTVNIGGAGYVAADLQVAGFEATSGTFLGDGNILTVARGSFNVITSLSSVNHNITSTGKAFNIITSDSQPLAFLTNNTTALTLDTSQNASFTNSVSLLDSKQLLIGSGSDLRLFHTGGNSYIENVTGDLYFKLENVLRINSRSNESMIIATPNAAVELYYDSSKKFETTNTGVSVTGGGTFTGSVTISATSYGLSIKNYITSIDVANSILAGYDAAAVYLGLGYGTKPIHIGSTNSGDVKILTTGNTIVENGSVGIGTDSPSDYYSDNLVVKQASGAGGITIATDTSSEGALYFADGTSGNQRYEGGVGYNHSINKLFLVSGGQSRVFIDSTGNVGIGTDSPTGKLHIQQGSSGQATPNSVADQLIVESSGAGGISILNPSSQAGNIFFGDESDNFIGGIRYFHNLDDMAFIVSNAERMRIDSTGNVGIGTDSPNSKLTVFNAEADTSINVNTGTGGSYPKKTGISFGATSTSLDGDAKFTGGAGIQAINTAASGNPTDLTFWTNSVGSPAERMRIDSSGTIISSKDGAGLQTNLLLSNLNDIDGDATGIGFSMLNNNTFVKGGMYFIRTTTQGRGDLVFLNNSENNGNNATLSDERMRIDASGNVGIGTTSPTAKLEISESRDTKFIITSSYNGGWSTQNYGHIEFKSGDNSGTTEPRAAITGLQFSNGAYGGLGFSTHGLSGSLTEAMRIDSAGNVGIGTISPDARLDVSGGLNSVHAIFSGQVGRGLKLSTEAHLNNDDSVVYDAQTSTGVHLFKTNATERMRITSGGQVLFNGISSLPSAAIHGGGYKASGVDGGYFTNSTDRTTLWSHFLFYNSNGLVGNISTSGSATSYNTSSDYRLKEDLKDFAGLDMVSKIPVYDYKWKSDESRSYGVMAHELQDVLPDAVSGEKDAEEMQGVDYSKIVPLLVKSIQELKAEIEDIKSKCNCLN